MNLFSQFPIIDYNGKSLVNIMIRPNIIKGIFDKYKTYYDYVIKDGERPDMIGHDYYGDSEHYWLVLMSNYLFDPYFQWPLENRTLHKYIAHKYGSIEQAKTEIVHYKFTGITGIVDDPEVNRVTWTTTPSSWMYMTVEEKSEWTAVYGYEYEIELNECKRSIRLISNIYLPQIVAEVTELMDE